MYIIAHTVVVIVEEPLKQKTNHSHTRAMHWGERKWEMDCFAESQSTFLEMLPVSSICAKIFSRRNLSRFSSAEHWNKDIYWWMAQLGFRWLRKLEAGLSLLGGPGVYVPPRFWQRGTLCPPHYYLTPGFSDLPTALPRLQLSLAAVRAV